MDDFQVEHSSRLVDGAADELPSPIFLEGAPRLLRMALCGENG
jgi:hypothetical protein